jgi:hypothetical protein
MSFRGRKKIKIPVKKKAAVPKTRKAAVPKTRKAAVPKTRKAAVPKTRKAAVPKTTKSNSETVAINENFLLKNNFNKTNADLIRVKKSNDDLLRQNNSLLAQITKLESLEKVTKEKEIPTKTKEISTLKQRLALVQKEKIQFQDKNVRNERKIKDAMIRISDLEEQLKKKGAIPTIQPIAKTEFTNIFKEIIENFNQQSIGNENSKMDYIISDMDVELKAQVSYNSKGKMVLGTPDIANIEKAKESLSVMKFKIRPIPRTNSVKIQ